MKNVSFILIVLLIGCSEKNNFTYNNLPHMLNNEIPSLTEDMFLNLIIDTSNLPESYNYIIQITDKDTLNILQFDKKKRLVFKSYRQFVDNNWNGKYVTMIEGHIYKDDRLVKTYYLHSNVGFKFYIYSEKDDKVVSIKEFELKQKNKINSNPYDYIKHISNLNQLISFTEKVNLEKKSKQISETRRKFLENVVQEYWKGENIDTFNLSNTFVFHPETNNLIYSIRPNQILNYSGVNKISFKLSKENHEDDYKTIRYEYNQDSLIETTYSNGKPFIYRIIKNNNEIYLKYIRYFDSTDYDEYRYELDEKGVPKTVYAKYYDERDTIKLKTIYK